MSINEFLMSSSIFSQGITVKAANFFTRIYENLVFTLVENGGAKYISTGLLNTLLISAFSLIIGVAVGILVAIVKIGKSNTVIMKIFRFLADFYITVIRGTPVLVQLIIAYYAIFPVIAPGTPALVVAMIGFGINSGAYVAEIIRSGILAVDKGQMEAGRSLGLSQAKTMKLIIMPQAIKNILPALGNEFIALIKETSIAGYITIMDLTRAADAIQGKTYDFFTPYLLVSIIYLIIVVVLTKLLSMFERRLRKSDNR
ncbi:MAG: amino acid ABC transporter permease [Eubacteriales bacterium]|nr:amino acid ABC transporter permease [Eubacteriales bacterium]MDD4476499.1 amino acid ABC transporter permease [Eubacteriales bacterium]